MKIIDQQLKLDEVPSLAQITKKAGFGSNVTVGNYIKENYGEALFEKEFSYEAGKMKGGTLKDRKKIFNYLQNKNTTSLEKIGKNFKWNKPKTTGLVAQVLNDVYRKGTTGASVYLPKDNDL